MEAIEMSRRTRNWELKRRWESMSASEWTRMPSTKKKKTKMSRNKPKDLILDTSHLRSCADAPKTVISSRAQKGDLGWRNELGVISTQSPATTPL